MRYYHGGYGGLRIGDLVLPPSQTGRKGSKEFGNYMADVNKVYITTEYQAAALYASGMDGGRIYDVVPGSGMEDDTDCKTEGLSFSCDFARVIRVRRIPPKLRRKCRELLRK